MKKSLLCVLSFFAAISLVSAQDSVLENDDDFAPPTPNARVGLLNGPSCIPAAYLMETSSTENDLELTYEKFADPQALLPKLIKAEADIGFMPVNVAAKVYNSSNKAIICAGICGNGNLAIISKDKSINKFSDLDGKTIYVAGQGATPEYIMRYVLSQYDLDNPITLDFSIPTANLPAAIISDKIEYAVVPEPFATIATLKDKNVVYAIDLQKEYKTLSSNNVYPLTCIVVRSKFAKENPEAVKLFLKKFSNAVNWTIKNPALAGEYCEKYELGLAANVVAKAIPKSNYVYFSAEESQKEIEDLLKIFIKNDPSSIGGKLPDKGFYLK